MPHPNAAASAPAPASPQLVRISSAARALNIVGDRWSLLILYAAFSGATRFDGFQKLTGMARSILADRLKRLEDAGVLKRRQYQDRPPRYEYVLTRSGVGLYPAALAVLGWEKRWHYDGELRSHRLIHSGCGKSFAPLLVCDACRKPIHPRDVQLIDGPGAGMEPGPKSRFQRRSTLAAAAPGGDQSGQLHPMIERSIDILGDRWTTQTLAAAFYGRRKFSEFQAALKAGTNILADRLALLVRRNILEKRQYQSAPARWEYRLTPEGLDIFPVIATLLTWGDEWLSGQAGVPEILIHKTCGHPMKPLMVCDQCQEPVYAATTRLPADDETETPGGGVRAAPPISLA